MPWDIRTLLPGNLPGHRPATLLRDRAALLLHGSGALLAGNGPAALLGNAVADLVVDGSALLLRHRLAGLSTTIRPANTPTATAPASSTVVVVVSPTQEVSDKVLDGTNGPLAPVVSSLLAPPGVGAAAAAL